MHKAPYTLSEAEKICRKYQYLVGKRFSDDSDITIDSVAVTPFDEISKKRFILYYLLLDNAEMALDHEYKGLLYDVLVLAGSDDGHELLHADIRVWLTKNKCLPACAPEVAYLIPMPVAACQ